MGNTVRMTDELRARILAEPEVILEDRDLMRALVHGSERAMGENIVDLRGVAMDRLEARLERLEDTHRTVIAAAYENLAGTHSVHRAVLRLLDSGSLEDFLRRLADEAASTMRVDAVRLVLESELDPDPVLDSFADILVVAEPGFIEIYCGLDRSGGDRTVILREAGGEAVELFGPRTPPVASEALIRLDLGPGRLPGLLALGGVDRGQFRPGQGTDLLAFFGGVFEREMRRWLA
jgi:uncharacterized protein